VVNNPHYKQGFQEDGKEIVRVIDAIKAQCAQAKYFFVSGALQEKVNIEVETDKAKVVSFLETLGFQPLLVGSLQKAESLYTGSADGFDLKSCLGFIRTFYEHLNIDGATVVAAQSGEAMVQAIDPALNVLRNKGILTAQQEKFARGLYTLLSSEGVHS
jgi:hypothetical protein